MSNQNSNESRGPAADQAKAEPKPRLRDAAEKASVEHVEYEESVNPDTELRLDGEEDTLYNDGLEVGDDLPVAGTDGDKPKGIKG
jgi:hypothetical protein